MARQLLEDYDLLQVGENDIFCVSFDLLTPRPHFIITKKPKIFIRPNINVIKDEKIMCNLINAAKSVLLSLKIPSATLSIHQGSWKSKFSRKFHAHLCVDTEVYLKIFSDTVEKDIPDLEIQIKNFITSKWRRGPHDRHDSNVEAYKECVRGYPYENYFDEKVTAIRNASSGPTMSGPSHVSADEVPVTNERSFNAVSSEPGRVSESLHKVYHTKHPMIGFVDKKTDSVEELKNVLSAMEGFAKEKGMTNYESKNRDDGCHLCLYLGSGTNIYRYYYLR